ncbi:MAG: hypothetical protein ACLQVX_19140 [Limisphaerales bacterium]
MRILNDNRPGAPLFRNRDPRFLAVLLALLCPAVAARAAGSQAPAAQVSTNAIPAAALTAATPQSVFIVPTSPRQGRNPFFPRSALDGAGTESKQQVVDTSAVVLNGLTSPPRVTAMINGRTFEPGESGQIKLPSGARVMVRCLEIRTNGVVAIIGAQRCELRLRHAL